MKDLKQEMMELNGNLKSEIENLDTERSEDINDVEMANEPSKTDEIQEKSNEDVKDRKNDEIKTETNELDSLQKNSEKENGDSVDENGNIKKSVNEEKKEASTSDVEESSAVSNSDTTADTTSSTTTVTASTSNADPTNTTRVRRRKQEHPFKSPEKNDPNFRGVHFYMQNHLTKDRTGIEFCIGGRFDCRRPGKRRQSEVIGAKCLIVGSYEYLERKRKSRRLNRKSFVKECASCRSRKTPLWRDVESVPLCNACGIRFKKYKLRCENCWSVPRKEKSRFPCEQCGGSIQDYN